MPVLPPPPKPPGKGANRVEKRLYELQLSVYELQRAVYESLNK